MVVVVFKEKDKKEWVTRKNDTLSIKYLCVNHTTVVISMKTWTNHANMIELMIVVRSKVRIQIS